MIKLKKLIDSYKWVEEIESRTIIELKKTSDMLEELHKNFFEQFGISYTKFNVLVLLYKGPAQGMMLSEIGNQMLVTKPNITGLIDRLEKQGFIKRVRHYSDRRKIMAVITQKGRDFTHEIIENYRTWIKSTMKILEEKEKNQLITILKKLQCGLINMHLTQQERGCDYENQD